MAARLPLDVEAQGRTIRGRCAKFPLVGIAIEQARAEGGAPLQVEEMGKHFDDFCALRRRSCRQGDHEENCEFLPPHDGTLVTMRSQDKRVSRETAFQIELA